MQIMSIYLFICKYFQVHLQIFNKFVGVTSACMVIYSCAVNVSLCVLMRIV